MSDEDRINGKKKYKDFLRHISKPISSSTLRYRRKRENERQAEQTRLQDEQDSIESAQLDIISLNEESLTHSSSDDIQLVTESTRAKRNVNEAELDVYPQKSKKQPSKEEIDDKITESSDNDTATSSALSSISENDSEISDENLVDSGKSGFNITNSENEFYNEVFSDSDVENNTDEISDKEHSNLYEESQVSKIESKLLITALSLRHSLPDIGLDNLVRLIDCHLPSNEYISKYRFLKFIPNLQYSEYYYCYACAEILKFEDESSICDSCNVEYRKSVLKKRNQYFLYMPLKEQLEEFVNSDIYAHCRKVDDKTSDIINGKVYRELRNKRVIGENDLTITWNTDGVNVFQLSKKSMWPLQVSINELPYRLRKNNVMICGLWHNEMKPLMNIFLQPFAEELLTLCSDGFESTTFFEKKLIKIKVHAIVSSVDSVARPTIQNMKQYNASYGCSYCFHEGEQIPTERGSIRVYPFEEIVVRTADVHGELVAEAVETGKTVKGVKGPSIMSIVPHLDIIYSYPPEYMHSCLLGVGKLFASYWFESVNNGEGYYIGSKMEEVNTRLLSIKPPTEITRLPQKIDNKYKASEWKNFILYYSLPCLIGLLPLKYFKHWFLFVYSLHIFLKTRISEDEFKIARKALYEFVQNAEKLYGKKCMKFNVHILLHIPKFVKLYGALWAWSAFPFEHYNGVLQNLFHGTQYVPEQILKLYCRLRYIKSYSHIFNRPECNKNVQSLFTRLMNQCKIKHCIEYGENLRVFGKPKEKVLSLTEKVLVEELLNACVEEKAFTYQRFIYNNLLFHASDYKRLTKRNNSCIMTADGSLISVQILLNVTYTHLKESKFVIIGKKFNILNEELCKDGIYKSSAFLHVAVLSEILICKNVSEIQSKMVNIAYENEKSCLFCIVNVLETD